MRCKNDSFATLACAISDPHGFAHGQHLSHRRHRAVDCNWQRAANRNPSTPVRSLLTISTKLRYRKVVLPSFSTVDKLHRIRANTNDIFETRRSAARHDIGARGAARCCNWSAIVAKGARDAIRGKRASRQVEIRSGRALNNIGEDVPGGGWIGAHNIGACARAGFAVLAPGAVKAHGSGVRAGARLGRVLAGVAVNARVGLCYRAVRACVAVNACPETSHAVLACFAIGAGGHSRRAVFAGHAVNANVDGVCIGARLG